MACVPFSSDAILGLVSTIRNNDYSAAFCSGIDEKPSGSGFGESLVYAVRFVDDVTWAVHVPVQAGTGLTPESLALFVESQAKVLTTLDRSGFRWSPKLIHYDTGYDNPIQHPYLVVSWIPGTALEWTDAVPSKPEDRAKILRQIVDIRLELAERTRVLRPGISALAFLTSLVDEKIMRAAVGDHPVFGIRDCFIQRALLRYVVHESLDFNPPVFAISHEALAAHNIVVDADYNITGIVGWAFARTLPLQLAFRLPRFLAIEPAYPSQTATPAPAELPAVAKQNLQPSPALTADRYFVRSYLSSLVSDPNHGERGALAQTMKVVFSDPDANWRYLIIEACFSKSLHAGLANRSWLLPGAKAEMAELLDVPSGKIIQEVEAFLDAGGADDGILGEKLWKAVHNSY